MELNLIPSDFLSYQPISVGGEQWVDI